MLNDFPNVVEGIEGIATNEGKIGAHRALIIAARANETVVSKLVEGALEAFRKCGLKAEDIKLVRVAGALEIPLALKKAASKRTFTTYVVLGAVIKGKTDHYEHVARMANDGVLRVAIEESIALGNGILTVHNLEQALERASGPYGNLGYDAACAAIDLYGTFCAFEEK